MIYRDKINSIFSNYLKVKKAIIDENFKINCAAVTLGFLFRKGLINPDHCANYLEILENFHAPGF